MADLKANWERVCPGSWVCFEAVIPFSSEVEPEPGTDLGPGLHQIFLSLGSGIDTPE